jgi:hypothetical protein
MKMKGSERIVGVFLFYEVLGFHRLVALLAASHHGCSLKCR